MSKRINHIIFLFGGQYNLSRILNIRHNAVSNWKKRDRVPPKQQIKLLKIAKSMGIPLSLDDMSGETE